MEQSGPPIDKYKTGQGWQSEKTATLLETISFVEEGFVEDTLKVFDKEY